MNITKINLETLANYKSLKNIEKLQSFLLASCKKLRNIERFNIIEEYNIDEIESYINFFNVQLVYNFNIQLVNSINYDYFEFIIILDGKFFIISNEFDDEFYYYETSFNIKQITI